MFSFSSIVICCTSIRNALLAFMKYDGFVSWEKRWRKERNCLLSLFLPFFCTCTVQYVGRSYFTWKCSRNIMYVGSVACQYTYCTRTTDTGALIFMCNYNTVLYCPLYIYSSWNIIDFFLIRLIISKLVKKFTGIEGN